MKALCIEPPGMLFKFGKLYRYRITFTGNDIIRPINEDMNIPIRPSFVTTSNKRILVNGTIPNEEAYWLYTQKQHSAKSKHMSMVTALKEISGLKIEMIRKNYDMDKYEAIVKFNESEFEKYFIKFL